MVVGPIAISIAHLWVMYRVSVTVVRFLALSVTYRTIEHLRSSSTLWLVSLCSSLVGQKVLLMAHTRPLLLRAVEYGPRGKPRVTHIPGRASQGRCEEALHRYLLGPSCEHREQAPRSGRGWSGGNAASPSGPGIKRSPLSSSLWI